MKFLFLALIGFLISVGSIQAQFWTQTGDNILGEEAHDFFGGSVSMSSDGFIVAIGAKDDYPTSMDAGYVKIFEENSGVWTQTGGDIIGDETFEEFGYSVDLNGDGSVVAIGSPGYSGFIPGSYTGRVSIYENNSGTWQKIGTSIEGEEGGDHFGHCVSLNSDGSIVAIGTFEEPEIYEKGYVRIYKNNEGEWQQIGEDITGDNAGDYFGYSVSLSSDGSIVAIGATQNYGNGTDPGFVRVFENNAGVWQQIGTDIIGENVDDTFGFSVSLSSDGSILSVGAPYNDGNGGDAGHVRVFQNNGGIWEQLGADIDGEAMGDSFGFSVGLNSDGSIVAIGGRYNNGNGPQSGHVRIFQYEDAEWKQVGYDIDGEAQGDNSGYVSLSSDGLKVAIGAPRNDENGLDAGNVRVFGSPTVGTGNIVLTEISVYPNPSNGFFTIENAKGFELSITDISGKTHYKIVIKEDYWTVELGKTFCSGIYFVHLISEKESYTKKILIKKG